MQMANKAAYLTVYSRSFGLRHENLLSHSKLHNTVELSAQDQQDESQQGDNHDDRAHRNTPAPVTVWLPSCVLLRAAS